MSLFKGYHSLFRYLGIIGAIFALVQAAICIPLAITGFFFACIRPNISPSYPIGHAFCYLYFTNKPTLYDNYINPTFFLIITIFAIGVYTTWLVFSALLLKVFYEWHDENEIDQITVRWLTVTVTVCVFDFVIFLLFLLEFYMIVMDPDIEMELINTGNMTKEVLANDFLKNREIITDLMIEQQNLIDKLGKEFPDFTLAPDEDSTDDEVNPFVENKNFFEFFEAHKKNMDASMFDFDKNYGVWSWFAAPPAIVMTVVMKTYIGFIANLVILGCMYDFHINKDSHITILSAPTL